MWIEIGDQTECTTQIDWKERKKIISPFEWMINSCCQACEKVASRKSVAYLKGLQKLQKKEIVTKETFKNK